MERMLLRSSGALMVTNDKVMLRWRPRCWMTARVLPVRVWMTDLDSLGRVVRGPRARMTGPLCQILVWMPDRITLCHLWT